MQTTGEVPPGAAFAYEVTVRALDEQLHRIEALDAKSGILMATTGVLAGFLFGSRSALGTAPGWLGALITAALFSAFLLCLLAFANRHYEGALAPRAVIRMATAQPDWLRWRFVGNIEKAIATNDRKLRSKARLVTGALFSLLVTVASLGGYSLHEMVA